jgi:hypothetical protein
MFDPELINQLVQRELQKDKMAQVYAIRPEEQQAPPEVKPINPKVAMLLGGLGDVASTYWFLKNTNRKEGNPAFQYFNKKPWTVAPTAAAAGLGYNALHGFLKSKFPKVADTAAGLLGGYQTALAGHNFSNEPGSYRRAVNDLQLKGNDK